MLDGVIITTPPYADYIEEAAAHPLVIGLRLNTVMPMVNGPIEALDRLRQFGKPLWVDLKGRQLRVVGSAVPPFTEVHLSHEIKVHTPTLAFFSDGLETARVVGVNGNRLILENGPRRVIGPGESVNIVHPSLKILGTLTETDKAYLVEMKTRGLSKVMLSYVETAADIQEVRNILPNADIRLKIETQRGLDFVQKFGANLGHLIAARGDLYIEVPKPHKIIRALQDIIKADPFAYAASRILDSMAYEPVPSSAEINDIAYLLSIGYKTLMLGDAVCLSRESLMESLNLIQYISKELNEI